MLNVSCPSEIIRANLDFPHLRLSSLVGINSQFAVKLSRIHLLFAPAPMAVAVNCAELRAQPALGSAKAPVLQVLSQSAGTRVVQVVIHWFSNKESGSCV